MKYKIRQLPDGRCQVMISFPLDPANCTPERAASLGWGWSSIKKAARKAYRLQKQFMIIATGAFVAGTLFKAARVASKIAKNPAIAALLPPGTAQALKITLLASKAAQQGKLPMLLARLKGPGAKRLIKAIAKMQRGKRKRRR